MAIDYNPKARPLFEIGEAVGISFDVSKLPPGEVI